MDGQARATPARLKLSLAVGAPNRRMVLTHTAGVCSGARGFYARSGRIDGNSAARRTGCRNAITGQSSGILAAQQRSPILGSTSCWLDGSVIGQFREPYALVQPTRVGLHSAHYCPVSIGDFYQLAHALGVPPSLGFGLGQAAEYFIYISPRVCCHLGRAAILVVRVNDRGAYSLAGLWWLVVLIDFYICMLDGALLRR